MMFLTHSQHDYSRRSGLVSWAALLAAAALYAAPMAQAQYGGKVKPDDAAAPTLRAIGVLEWTGEIGKAKTSRLVPVAVYDGTALHDAGLYLARPAPLALETGVEYVLQKNGTRVGLFDIDSAARQQEAWIGLGGWKPMPVPKAAPLPPARIDDAETNDRPTLHRKRGSEDKSPDTKGSPSSAPGPAPDPDRPTLHKKQGDTPQDSSSGGAPSAGAKPSAQDDDSDRPTLARRAKGKPAPEQGYSEGIAGMVDTDRPHLSRGKPTGTGPEVTPTLAGMPEGMGQMVAVSDAADRPLHEWSFSWANPNDELRLRTLLEEQARAALGVAAPAPVPQPKAKHTATKTRLTLPPPVIPLDDVHFRVYELAYGAGATFVYSASVQPATGPRKFVTLIAQPGLYEDLRVLFKSVTDAAHLEDTPRMVLVDAVDALADNRAELLFELRSTAQRQFALYRVLRGRAEQLFVTGGGDFATGPGTR